MNIKWFEDFLSLTSTRSFSRSAEERHITQSTLSRRMQALEDWVGVPLIDRHTHPISLTAAGEQLQRDGWYIVRRIHRASTEARARGFGKDAPIRFGAQHAIARYFLLPWLKQVEQHIDVGAMQLRSDNLSNLYDDLLNNNIDFLICYQLQEGKDTANNKGFPSVQIAKEKVKPVSIPDKYKKPLFMLPGKPDSPVPSISFGPDVPVGLNRDRQLEMNEKGHLYLINQHEASMGEIIREMVLDGRGMAWLQECLINKDLEEGRLVLAGEEKWYVENEIWIYSSLNTGKPKVERVWEAIKDMNQFQP